MPVMKFIPLPLLVFFSLALVAAQAVPVLEISSPGNGTMNGDYTTSKLFVNELAGDSIPLTMRFQPNEANVTKVEVFTNLNRRERALLDADGDNVQDGIKPPDGSLVVAGSDAHYYKAYTMSAAAGGWFEAVIHASKTGAYRLTARFETNNSGTWQYYGGRDHAVVVSPSLTRDMVVYEVNPLNVEAEGTLESQRSTLVDLWDGPGSKAFKKWNLEYVKSLGANWLWFQPIHPFGVDGRHLSAADMNARDASAGATTWRWNGGSPYEDVNYPYAFGSPYAVKNFWEVEPRLSKANTRAAAMTEFQDLVAAADAADVSIMLDAAFNHTAWDVEAGQMGADLGFGGTATTEIRNAEARFFSRTGDYHNRASGAGNIAPAPDRYDFNKWLDAKDVYFGRYASLWQNSGSTNAQKSEADWFDYTTGTGLFDVHTQRVWQYFGQYVVYWLEKTGHPAGTAAVDHKKGIDGLRCDFGQGLPPQCWEYIINVARSTKWSFVFMAESLDGGAVTYRSNRHFDVLNEDIVFTMKGSTTVPQFRSAFESRRSAYGQGLVLLNTVSHDENNFASPWEALLRYGVYATIGGVPMIFYGQEQGLEEFYGFDLQERNVGKFIPHFKTYNSMMPLWNDTDVGKAQLYPVYAGINAARNESPALRSGNRYFLSLQGGGTHDKIWANAKYELAGASPAFRDVVFGFVNVDRNNDWTATFDVNASGGGGNLFGIQSGRLYNLKNRAAYTGQNATRRDVWLWGSDRTGADLLANGVEAVMKRVPQTAGEWTTAPYEAQFLKLYDVTAPPAPGAPEEMEFRQYVIGDEVTFSWVTNVGFGDNVTGFRVDAGTTPGGNDIADGVMVATSQATIAGLLGQTVYLTVRAVSSAGIASAGGTQSIGGVILLDAQGDHDADGVINADEDVAGTDPLDAGSLFGWVSITKGGGSVALRYRSVPGRLYTIESSVDLLAWDAEDETDAVEKAATGTETVFTDLNAGGGRKFYRARVRKAN